MSFEHLQFISSMLQILHLLSAPEDIFSNAYAYLLVIFLGIPFTMLYNFFSSVLRAIGDSQGLYFYYGCRADRNRALGQALGEAVEALPIQALIGERP